MIHESDVSSVAFSSDSKYVISGSVDNTARVWEIATGTEVARMIHEGYVSSVAFSPDGQYAISGGVDNTVRVWIWHPEDLIAYVCSQMTRNLTRAEWNQYIGDASPYQAVCPNLPIELEPTSTAAP
jgi:WD40 repeat protein